MERNLLHWNLCVTLQSLTLYSFCTQSCANSVLKCNSEAVTHAVCGRVCSNRSCTNEERTISLTPCGSFSFYCWIHENWISGQEHVLRRVGLTSLSNAWHFLSWHQSPTLFLHPLQSHTLGPSCTGPYHTPHHALVMMPWFMILINCVNNLQTQTFSALSFLQDAQSGPARMYQTPGSYWPEVNPGKGTMT